MSDEAATGRDAGPDDPAAAADLLALPPGERRERGYDDAAVTGAFLTVLAEGDRGHKELGDVTLPELDLRYRDVEGANRHPVDLTDATVEALRADFAEIRLPLVLDDAEVGELSLEEARIDRGFSANGATVDAISAEEAVFAEEVDFAGATMGPVEADDATFDDDASFDGATFEGTVRLRGAEFHGDSNLLEDNTSFTGATFAAEVDCTQAEFGFAHFEDAVFEADAVFEEAAFDGDAAFDDATFRALADFDEADFREDTAFEAVDFEGPVDFRGAEFFGGARALEADASFADASFAEGGDFRRAAFRHARFDATTFGAEARFREVVFADDGDFPDADFESVDFDEARFEADADFSGARFRGEATFRGAEFLGDANHVEDNATFEGARFETDVDFRDANFTSGNFMDTRFGGEANFARVSVSDRVDFRAVEIDADALVDFSGASLTDGRIVQPDGGWVGYDFTGASVGDLTLEAESTSDRRELLDYFRIVDTEFTEFDGHEFDFSRHTDYLDRNDWVLHEFADEAGDDPALDAETVERTYLKAKHCASAAGDKKAAGEFRVKRQRFARKHNLSVARDPAAGLPARVRNATRVAENAFLDVTCGHGMRLLRIVAVFLLAPLLPALLYAFGGPMFATSAGQVESLSALATPAGRATLFRNVHFSYISYTTIGYGYIGPKGALARVLAGSEAYLSTVLAALVVYALVKRSEL